MKYSEQLVAWLQEEGYSHCFFVAGGNIMHLLDSVRSKMVCIPFVNEIGAAIAAEYFTEATSSGQGKAFVLVTAGPGLTNTLTAMASAWAESRELLVVGGQVKTSDLSLGAVRQRGIQEVDGVTAAGPFTKARLQIKEPTDRETVIKTIRSGAQGRKGPVFLEVTLDAQGAPSLSEPGAEIVQFVQQAMQPANEILEEVALLLKNSTRPIILIGAGVSREGARRLQEKLADFSVPIMLTWNAADRYSENFALNFGRPNIWGQRYSNVLLQQADLVIAAGSRLGIQQTGFSWEQFVPGGKIIHVDIDSSELMKSHPHKDLIVQADAEIFLSKLIGLMERTNKFDPWLNFCREVKRVLPTSEAVNKPKVEFINPFELMLEISGVAQEGDFIIPSSSGASFTVAMQTFQIKDQQTMITNKGLASMGYGLSGAIGAALRDPKATTWHFEGDGGFAQNLQELGTVSAQNLNIKMFIMSNNGYASIRMTQRNYFNGSWIGCDAETGLGLPGLEELASAYSIAYVKLSSNPDERLAQLRILTEKSGPVLIEVPIDPEQSYFPKISSRALPDGSMKSNPLHIMEPQLSLDMKELVFRYLKTGEGFDE